jgi:hypothetical protein
MMEEFKYCPACGEEFEAYLDHCPHCATPLVDKDDLPEVNVVQGEAGENEAVVHITEDLGEAEYIAETLGREGLSVQVYSIDTEAAGLTFRPRTLLHIAVPTTQQERALSVLQFGLSAPRGESISPEEFNLKKRRLEAAIRAEEAGLPALEEFFGETIELRQQAMDSALEFVEGVDLLINWIVRNCLEQELAHGILRAVGEACRLLGEEEPEQAAREFAQGLKSPDAWSRRNFCFVLGKLGADLVIPPLVNALHDPDPAVRSEAIDQLYALEGTSLGYDSDLEPEQQSDALAKWKKLASRIEFS